MTISAAIAELQTLLGDRLVTSQAVRALHGQNEAHFAPALPDAVAFPNDTAEVAQIVTICAAQGCPIIPFGAGSALEGQHLATQGGVSLDFANINQILSISPEDLQITVQPGLTRIALNDALRDTGLFFSVDPGADATVGGMAATRASGTTAVRYGTMRENVLALEVVLADGRVIRTGSGARKSSSGYDLTHLMVGSEGTLGIITELTLKLHGLPEATSAASCVFDTVKDAVDAAILTIQSGLPVARIELLDEVMAEGFNLHAGTNLPLKPHLFLEFHGSAQSVAQQAEDFAAIAAEFGASDIRAATRAEDRTAMWKMRHSAHYATSALEPGKRTLATDVCVPISKLAEAVVLAQDEARRLGLKSAIVGHVGDGNFHCGVRCNMDDAEEWARVVEFTGLLSQTALRMGGTVTGEHGIGIGKQKYMRAEHGDALDVMRTLKAALDPQGILNPGKMLPAQE